METAAYGACKRIEIFSTSLLESTDENDEGESTKKVRIDENIYTFTPVFSFLQMTPTAYRNEANSLFQTAQQSVQSILAIADPRKE